MSPTTRRPATLRTALCTLLLSVHTAGAQPAPQPLASQGSWPLIGRVEGERGEPLVEATIEGAAQRTRTDATGHFQLRTTRRDTLTLLLRHVGYEPMAVTLRAEHLRGDTVLLRMDRTAQALEAVRIRGTDLRSPLGLGGFDERRARGIGTFVTREEIEHRQTSRLSDVLRGRRGLTLVRTPTGAYGVRFGLASGRQRRCIPDLWIDGQRARGMEIDDIPASTVEGIELYSSIATVPFQFSTSGAGTERCGTVVVWTRPPG
ncbi:MAG: hypothetical protein FJ361_07845 [Gemmatimonadetes bacterium]|nr:hypothetical protein [Gemmatimonadota bacterium]